MIFGRDPLAFPYPTSATFAARVCLGVAVVLLAAGAAVHGFGTRIPWFWLATPGAVALAASWAVGPGMREEFVISPKKRNLLRRIRTLGWPSDEEVVPPQDIRMVGVARLRGDDGQGPVYCVLVDQRARWVVLSFRTDAEAAKADRKAVAAALSLPEADFRLPDGWTPYWGRVQPPPPPAGGLPPEAVELLQRARI